ncbi:MAG TPA: hypothetical protein VMU11_03950 [Verrucomicrobiae bacterium]|nr:hypothetical protein [Verrucomicrobiae bacterium]
MTEQQKRLTAAEREGFAAAALEDIFKLIGYCALPASPVLRHLTHVYWNFRYIGQNNDALRRIQAAKDLGVEWADFYQALRLRFRREDDEALAKVLAHHTGPVDAMTVHSLRQLHCRRQIELVMCSDMLPDHLLNADGTIVWTQDRPHHTFEPMRCDPDSIAEAAAASDDPLESP